MAWQTPVLGAVISIVLMVPVAGKWNILGWPSLGGMIIACVGSALPFYWICPDCATNVHTAACLFAQIALALTLALSMIMLRFWRDPERVPPEDEGVVVSAADGKVIYIRAVEEGAEPLVTKGGRDYLLRELTGTSVLSSAVCVIGVDMSVLDVHVTRCPIAGQVKLQKHIAGKFMSLKRDEAPFVNQRVTTLIDSDALSIVVVQVASRLVRCIESYRSVGETVHTGQRLGMIKFGSLVAVVLPKRNDVMIEVRPGDRVIAGVSVLARYRAEAVRGIE